MQGTWDGHSVMSHRAYVTEHTAGNQSIITLVAYLCLFPGALVASRVHFSPSAKKLAVSGELSATTQCSACPTILYLSLARLQRRVRT